MGSVGQIAAGRHEYRLRGTQKALHLLFAVVLGGLATLFFVLSAGELHPSTTMVASAALAASGLYMAVGALRSRLAINGTRVRVQGAFRAREFDMSQVEGYRTYKGRYQSYRVICLANGAGKIPLLNYTTDDSLEEWIAGLKDLDQQDREQLLQKIDQDQELGATPEERQKALARSKQVNITLWVLDGVAAAAFVWGPGEYHLAALAVLALAPVVAAYLLYRQPLLYTMFHGLRDPRGDVSPVLIISAYGLLLGANRVNFISMGMLFPFIGFGVLALLVMFYPSVRKSPRFATALTGLCIVSALYGWGLVISVDTVADRSAPQTYAAQVLDSYVSRGSRSTSYYLKLEPWGPYTGVNTEMKVSEEIYSSTRPGDIVCLGVHAGVLRVPWYEPVACANTGTQ